MTRALWVAALLGAGTLAVFWPGVAMYDSVGQYGQALAGVYDDWHPPIMARLWSLFGARGAGPMLVLQVAGYWLGLGLLAGALVATGRRGAAVATIAIGAWPPFLGWQVAILKDAQMLAAGLAATGLVGWWRLRGQRMPVTAGVLAGVLLVYATLLRANAVFATIPLAILLIGRPQRPAAQIATVLAGIVAVLGMAPIVNHAVLRAQPSGVERTQALYDLAAIGVETGGGATGDGATGLSPGEVGQLRDRHCVSPFFWDPLGSADRCDAAMAGLRATPVPLLYGRWARSIATHPIIYTQHRLAHLDSTERWIVPWRWPGAAPAVESEPNDLGLASPGGIAQAFQRLAALLVETPPGWPIVWTMLAMLIALPAWRRPATPATRIARALIASSLTLEASFAVLSIASDLRYHLWSMVMTAIAAVLLADRRPRRPAVIILAAVIVTGLAARALLPVPPQSYAGMLRWSAKAASSAG